MTELFSRDNLLFLLAGLRLTLVISLVSILLSLLFGTVLAVLKNYRVPVLGRISAVYIDIFRNTPLLLWILAIRFLVPIPALASGILSMTLFTTAMMAEIVRGGLNSVDPGTVEAAQSQGFTAFQTLIYIVLPQTFRNIVPALLSQVITLIKDSSFLWAVAIEEFSGKAFILMGKYTTPVQIFSLFGLVALTYFVIDFVISLFVRKRENKRPA